MSASLVLSNSTCFPPFRPPVLPLFRFLEYITVRHDETRRVLTLQFFSGLTFKAPFCTSSSIEKGSFTFSIVLSPFQTFFPLTLAAYPTLCSATFPLATDYPLFFKRPSPSQSMPFFVSPFFFFSRPFSRRAFVFFLSHSFFSRAPRE